MHDPDGDNFARAAEAQRLLIASGFAPLNPGLTTEMPGHEAFTHEAWLDVCKPWVASSDLVVRIPGKSPGADIETDLADQLGIPCFYPSHDAFPGPGTAISKLVDYLAGYDDAGLLRQYCNDCKATPPSNRQIQVDDQEATTAANWLKTFYDAQGATADEEPTDEALGAIDAEEDKQAALDAIREERGKVYGDPRENHEGIAQMFAPLLKPWADLIADQVPLPPHVVTLLMCAVKINRMRRVYHPDNFDDLRNYADMTEELHQQYESENL